MNTYSGLATDEGRFAFGKNWDSYSKLVTESRIETSVSDLQRLLGGRLDGKRFLDVGCGSGLHALAALRLGASEVVAIDIDADSVETTQRILRTHAPDRAWRAARMSVFELDPEAMDRFDVVYSWGVLHHTGNLQRAIRQVAGMTLPTGCFAFSLYRRSRLCWFWKIEKRWYAQAGPRLQAAARAVYLTLYRTAFLVRGRSFSDYVERYSKRRGMDYRHDVHDWLGGWPYESISPADVERMMRALGMHRVRAFVLSEIPLGLFGTGCDEYVYSPELDQVRPVSGR